MGYTDMHITDLQQGLQRITPRSHPPLHVGDLLLGRVLRSDDTDFYVVSIRGKTFTVQSNLNLQPGQFVLLQLVATDPRPRFKLVESFSQVNETVLAHALDHFIQTQGNSLLRSYIQLSLSFQLPINITFARFLEEHYRGIKRKLNPSPEHYLLPYFFQNGVLPAGYLSNPFFLLQWYWGEFRLRNKIKELKGALHAPEEEQISLLQDLEELEHQLEEFFHLTSLLSLLQARGREGQNNLAKHFKALKTALERFIHSSGEIVDEQGRALLEEFFQVQKFLLYQIQLFQHHRWACFPVYLHHSEGFFFLKKGTNDAENSTYHFKFCMNGVFQGELLVNGTIQGSTVKIEFRHPNQEMKETVENNLDELKERLSMLGLQLNSLRVELIEDSFNFYDEIIPRKSFNLNRFL
ncbi:MAG: flagellar hook-length control protein FliK [Calditrichaeota bacterium]|nr:MAG: flagellar hook-length control protein FliK [Calditrichota bacterium]